MRYWLLVCGAFATGCQCCSCPPGRPADAGPPDLQSCGIPNGDPPDGGYVLNQLKLSPAALFDDEFATTPVELTVCAGGAGDLQLTAHFWSNWFDGSLPIGDVSIPLRDDGVDGRCGTAHSFTASITTNQTPRLRYGNGTVDALQIDINYVATTPPTAPISSQVRLGVVSRALQVATTTLASDVIAASNVVNVVLKPSDCQREYEEAVTAMRRVYAFYPDVFDGFAVYEYGLSTGMNIPVGSWLKNVVSGINLDPYDGSSVYGSNGVLHMGTWIHTDLLGLSQVHEIGHSFNFYYSKPILDLTRGGGDQVHVGSPTTMLGIMGEYFLLQPQADGSFLVALPTDGGHSARQFAYLELYSMGLVPASMVPSDWWVLDPTITNAQPGDVIPRASATLVSIDDIQRVYGVRAPDASASQKSFRFVFIGVSERPMTAAEIALLNRIAVFYSGSDSASTDSQGLFTVHAPGSFAWATRGFGTLVTALPATKP